jgi:hypothetical protein
MTTENVSDIAKYPLGDKVENHWRKGNSSQCSEFVPTSQTDRKPGVTQDTEWSTQKGLASGVRKLDLDEHSSSPT